LGDAEAAHRVQLANLALLASLTSKIKHVLGHVGLDQAGADCVYANVSLLKLICACLRDRVHTVIRNEFLH